MIAAIEGWCVAGGIELAAWCDLRVAGDVGAVRVPRAPVGRAADRRRHYRLPRIVGLGRALDLILTGREFGADEARAHRLRRTGSCPTAPRSTPRSSSPSSIASFPWACVVNDRRCVYDGLGLGLEDALANEDRLGRETIFAEGFADGVARFERRERPVPGM